MPEKLPVARSMFQKGDRVKLTEEAAAQRRQGFSKCGTVVGFGRYDHIVRLRRDGRKQPDSWYCGFWRKEAAHA